MWLWKKALRSSFEILAVLYAMRSSIFVLTVTVFLDLVGVLLADLLLLGDLDASSDKIEPPLLGVALGDIWSTVLY